MVNSRLILGFVAFSVSFGIHLVMARDLGKAFVGGLITVPAVYIAVGIAKRQQLQWAETRMTELKDHIAALHQRRVEAYQSFTAMLEEKEQVAMALNSLQHQLYQSQALATPQAIAQLPSANLSSTNFPVTNLPMAGLPPAKLAAPQKPLSWDLSIPATSTGAYQPQSAQLQTVELLPTQISDPSPNDSSPPAQAASETVVTQSGMTADLKVLQAELNQLKTRVKENYQVRDRLNKEIADLKQQRKSLSEERSRLQGNVQELEQYRQELEQFLSVAKTKKQELETGTNPLQGALEQLQTQVTALQKELRGLETQVVERRSQKGELERQLAESKVQLQAQTIASQEEMQVLDAQLSDRRHQKQALEQELIALEAQRRSLAKQIAQPPTKPIPPSNSQTLNSRVATETPPLRKAQPPAATQPPNGKMTNASLPASSTPLSSNLPTPSFQTSENPSQDLPDEWQELMMQLPEYELEVLRAIVEQNNSVPVIRKIAEENLTMPELLIDSINERALETIGDLIISTGTGVGSAKISREHLKAVRKLLNIYEYLQ